MRRAVDPTFFLLVIAVAPLLASLSTLQAGIWLGHGGATVPWQGLLRARIVDFYIYAAFLPLLFTLARRFPFEAEAWPRSLAVHLAASLVCALLKEVLFTLIGNWFRPGVFNLLEILAEDYAAEVFTFWALIALVHALLFYRRRTEPAPATTALSRAQFIVRDRSGVQLIPAGEVAWIGAQGNYAELHSARGRLLIRETMASLERRLAPQFVRVHRRALVDLGRVARVDRAGRGRYTLVLDDGAAITVGRAYAGIVRRLFG